MTDNEPYMSDTEPSISEREAEERFPHHLLSCMPQTLEDVQEAYMLGRTAEPCKEQVRAAAEALSAHMDELDIDHGFELDVDNGFFFSCKAGGYTYKDLWAHLARVCLNAAREAVM